MKRSTDRILTTHVGSLVRPGPVAEILRSESLGQPYDEAEFEKILTPAVEEVVRQQAEAGVDVPSDGEFGKTMWTGYVVERIGGLEWRPGVGALSSKDRTDFAEFYAVYNPLSATMWLDPQVIEHLKGAPLQPPGRWWAHEAVTYKGKHAIDRDIANFKAALGKVSVEDAFLPLAAPASVEASVGNDFYKTDEEYVYALADALRPEYQAVLDAGLTLQVDDAFIPYNYDRMMLMGASMEEYLKHCEMRVEAVNYAMRGMPEDRIRYHVCWGSWAAPHSSDVPLKDIVDLVLKVNAGAYSVEAANPRHEHEWMVWEDTKLPEGKILIPGVVTHSTNVLEHPDLVAWRLKIYAGLVGKENLMAGTDCGFSQGWSMACTHPTVQWAKLQALAEGARRGRSPRIG